MSPGTLLATVLTVSRAALPTALLACAALAAECPSESLTADFPQRDALAREAAQGPSSDSWGPRAVDFPAPQVPEGCDPVEWKRQRVLTAAEHYAGLPYRHHHVPGWDGGDGPGLDCSNFTAWVYNFALGVRFTSNVRRQADGFQAPGRRLAPQEPLAPGDLLFILRRDRSEVSHVAIRVDEATVIDSHGRGVARRPFAGWYRTHFSHARRIVE